MLQYAAPIFLGAFLLFQVQPIIARYILPWFGGTPAVWTTCMLFFQMLLLLGYAYAHLVISRLTPRRQALVHGALLVVSLGLMGVTASLWGAPIIPSASWKPPDADLPVLRILLLLTISVGLPYFVLSTTSPMLQAWFSRTNPGVSPYRLYTLSNIGSLLALLSYPFLVEPALAMKAQANAWSVGYGLFVLGYAACAGRVWRQCGRAADSAAPGGAAEACEPEGELAPTWRRKWLWVGLPALASVMLLAITNQMCQEVAVIPFLWIIPLSLYLLSFIICFDNERWYIRRAYLPLLLLCVPAAAAILIKQGDLNLKLQIGIYSLTLFVVCMVCHGELVALKPKPKYLTGFYLGISVGGAIGGLFVGLMAPFVFKGFWELHIGLVFSWLLAIWVLYSCDEIAPGVARRASYFLMGVTLCTPFVALNQGNRVSGNVLLAARNFYGLMKVKDQEANNEAWHKHTLVHGRIIHGYQFLAPDKRRIPSSYYASDSGVGLALLNHPRRLAPDPARRNLRVGVIGLGTGSLAVYGQPGDTMRFYDINPEVARVAQDPRYFTYLTDCPAKVEIVLGDARVSMERELKQGPERFDVLILDAFSSDAIPAHLLTKEAFELYLQHLRGPDSLLAVHVSNKVLNLRPVVWKLADYLNLGCALIESSGDESITLSSDWMVLSRDKALLQQPQFADASTPRSDKVQISMWTDDYHNLFQILR